MKAETTGDQKPTLDAYIDGLMDGPERDDFARRIEQDPSLRDELAHQEIVDASLRRLFAPPSAETILSRAVEHQSSDAPAEPLKFPALWGRRLVIAAAVTIGVFSLWRIGGELMPVHEELPPGFDYLQKMTIEQAYTQVIDRGFKPQWVCKDDREFATTFWKRFDQGLLLGDLSPGAAAAGIAYGNVITERTLFVLARVGETKVIVFVDRAENDTGQTVSPGRDLQLFKRQVGNLVLYELTPLTQPHFLDSFYEPEMPDEWIQESS